MVNLAHGGAHLFAAPVPVITGASASAGALFRPSVAVGFQDFRYSLSKAIARLCYNRRVRHLFMDAFSVLLLAPQKARSPSSELFAERAIRGRLGAFPSTLRVALRLAH